MAKCCDENISFEGLSETYRNILKIIIVINAVMFLVEISSGFLAQSMALKADALDFLSDTLTYALTLWVIGKSVRKRAVVALIKGLSLAVMALLILGLTIYRVIVMGAPEAFTMGIVGILALAANLLSVLLLLKYKDGDSNIRSVWLCSRNDAIGNLLVIGAGIGVALTGTAWPDLIVAFLIAGLFTDSAIRIIRQAMSELRAC